MSHTASPYRSSRLPHQRRTCSGLVIASYTRWRGASKRRVRVISRSEGVVTLKVSLFATRLAGMVPLLRFRGLCPFQFLKVAVEAIETCFPDMAIAFGPVGDFLEWSRFD